MKRTITAALFTTLAAPVLAQETGGGNFGYAVVDMNVSNFDLSREGDNSTDFDASSVFLPNGQARFRLGSFVGEIQGTYSTNVEGADLEEEENSTSFGMFGHYVTPTASGEAAFSLGTVGGTSVEESDGVWYTSLGASYAQDGWMVGIGRLQRLGGEEDDTLKDFSYLQGSYTHALSEQASLFASGYYGIGNADGLEGVASPVHGANIDIGGSYMVSDQMTLSASIGRFILETQDTLLTNRSNGYSVKVGLSIALGGSSAQAKSAVKFDTPDFHREVTWCDETECGIATIPE